MNPIARPCGVCGRRVDSGKGRCPAHEGRAYALPVSCKVCGKLGPTSFCDAHKPDPFSQDASTSPKRAVQEWRRGYRDPDYHRNRQSALNRAGGACERCGRSDAPLEVDHIIPLSTADSPADIKALNHPGNLQVLCRPCHHRKTRRRG